VRASILTIPCALIVDGQRLPPREWAAGAGPELAPVSLPPCARFRLVAGGVEALDAVLEATAYRPVDLAGGAKLLNATPDLSRVVAAEADSLGNEPISTCLMGRQRKCGAGLERLARGHRPAASAPGRDGARSRDGDCELQRLRVERTSVSDVGA
jgi:hypothetical protein